MILKLKYFGMIAEAIAKQEESFDFSGNSVEELDVAIRSTYSSLKKMDYSFAVNQTMADRMLALNNNDEVALLPPFAGG